MTGLGLCGRSHKAIFVWLLPVLDLETCGGGLACQPRLTRTSVETGETYQQAQGPLGLVLPSRVSTIERASLRVWATLVDPILRPSSVRQPLLGVLVSEGDTRYVW